MPTLDWIGKQAVGNHHRAVPYHLMRDVPELGCGPADSGNLIVEGDNLNALKALLPYYAGQVKCISADETGPFISALITGLMQKKDFAFGRLVRERFVLRDHVEKQIDACRKLAKAEAFQDVLFQEKSGAIKVSADQVFTFDPDRYPARRVCERSGDFKQHFHRQVGELGEKGEEFECALFLDQLPEVETWVRNIEREPERSFWLPTATDRFYPDFVCKLKDGRILVVEFKGAHLWSNDDSKEKRSLGELWAERSDGKCLFVMPNGTDRAAITSAIKCKAP
jgi:type III restriction enzyme